MYKWEINSHLTTNKWSIKCILFKKIPEMKEEDLIDQDPLSPAALLFERHVIYGLIYTYFFGGGENFPTAPISLSLSEKDI